MEIPDEPGLRVILSTGDEGEISMICETGQVRRAHARLVGCIRYRRCEGVPGHYSYVGVDAEGSWWSADGLVAQGVVQRLIGRSLSGEGRDGGWFPTMLFYEVSEID